MNDQAVYLGDGVYASFDGFAIVLDLREQDNTTRIVLEHEVFEALIAYRDKVYDKRARRAARPREEI
jgi:hypothetical protein